ncbi:HDIG domain-containing protein [Gangjinia marincola]|uniref:HDIG domain-containing protein n=1 Tax=Gangjinia marincola TaxID=578463 RepID=A0ABP3XQX0_9FLAO
MKQHIERVYKNQSLIYKGVLFLLTTFLIVYLFPKGGKFKYEIIQGKPWQYENLYAPFDFAIRKTDEEIVEEKQLIKATHVPYYYYNDEIAKTIIDNVSGSLKKSFSDSLFNANEKRLVRFGKTVLEKIYDKGVLQDVNALNDDQVIFLRKGNTAKEVTYGSIFGQDEIKSFVEREIKRNNLEKLKIPLLNTFFNTVEPNVFLDEDLTQMELDAKLNDISYTRGSVTENSRIIAKGEVVKDDKYIILNSLKSEFESRIWSESNYYWLVLGYSILVALALLMLLLFIKKYRPSIFENNTKVTFIFFNILLMVVLTTLVIRFNTDYIYVIPLAILPLTLKAFFDARLGLFAHVLTVLLLGFIVPNSYEYMFLQIIAGIVTILTVSELYKRANLFISVGQITGIYILAYFAFFIIHEGNPNLIDWETFLLFILCGLATLFVQPLIYAYEKIFGLVSDMSLLELSDTNGKLLKELSDKAPGTFHHSLNVANLAEAAASEIGANSMLVRVGALYHDMGKMNNPTLFTENQTSSVNPHDELSPKESAEIIINHVIDGIEIAKKNNLPDRVIDFIRTHHGTSTVYYFYKKELSIDEEAKVEDFQYPGPKPYSKETAILMMADSVEAASKSIKDPTSSLIEKLVEKIVSKQMEEGQFLNADITFKEIQVIKKVLKNKLNNMYHLRIEYPE